MWSYFCTCSSRSLQGFRLKNISALLGNSHIEPTKISFQNVLTTFMQNLLSLHLFAHVSHPFKTLTNLSFFYQDFSCKRVHDILLQMQHMLLNLHTICHACGPLILDLCIWLDMPVMIKLQIALLCRKEMILIYNTKDATKDLIGDT